MRTVIRVQDIYGRGMFQMGNEEEEHTKSVYYIPDLNRLADRHSNFPNIRTDEEIHKFLTTSNYWFEDGNVDPSKDNWRFSFKNINQFEDWVERDEVRLLKENGYRVYKIDVDISVESQYQTIFDVRSVVNMVDITDLFLD